MGLRAETRSQLVLSLLASAVVLVVYALRRRVIGDAHTSAHGVEAEQSADTWMHEHISAPRWKSTRQLVRAVESRPDPPSS
jgi:hypothetical protein